MRTVAPWLNMDPNPFSGQVDLNSHEQGQNQIRSGKNEEFLCKNILDFF